MLRISIMGIYKSRSIRQPTEDLEEPSQLSDEDRQVKITAMRVINEILEVKWWQQSRPWWQVFLIWQRQAGGKISV